jgi:hypothetical protein
VTTRVYVPSTWRRLRAAVELGDLGQAPLTAHAVTDEVRTELADVGEEESEYAASSAAAQQSVALLDADEPARRVVLAVDVPSARGAGGDDPTLVEVTETVPMRRVAAVLADSADAEATVAAAREAVQRGSTDAERLLGRCLDHELGWWGAQEIGVLLAEEPPR